MYLFLRFRLLLATFAMMAAAADGYAQTYTWATQNGNWGIAGSWSPAAPPPNDGLTSADLVFGNPGPDFIYTSTLNQDYSARSITIDGANRFFFEGYTLTIGSGGLTNNGGNNTGFNTTLVRLGADQTWSFDRYANYFSLLAGLDSNGHALTISAVNDSTPQATTVRANMYGTGSLNKTGSGVLTLEGENTYTGLTTIDQGYLRLNSPNALAGSTLHTSSTGGTLVFAPNYAGYNFGGLSGNGDIALNLSGQFPGKAWIDVGANNADTTYSGSFSGMGGVTKSGTGTWTLTGVSTFEDTLLVRGGTLVLSGTSLNIGEFLLGNGTGTLKTLQEGNSSLLSHSKFIIANGNSLGEYELNGGTITSKAAYIGYDGAYGKMTQNGGSFTTQGYQLEIGRDGEGLYTLNGGTLTTGETILSGNGTLRQTEGNHLTETLFYNASNTSPAASYFLEGGVLTTPGIDAGNTSTQNRFLARGGTLRASNSTSRFVAADISFQIGQGGLTFDTNGYTITLGDGMEHDSSGPAKDGGLIKRGAGVLILDKTYTYTGDTEIQEGKLIVTGNAASSDIFVGRNTTLAGTGTFGDVRIMDDATIDPGNAVGPGTLRTGDQVWEAGGIYHWEINNATGTTGTNWDFLLITGQVRVNSRLDNPFRIDVDSLSILNEAGQVANFDPNQSRSWLLATASGGFANYDPSKFRVLADGFANPLNGRFAVIRDGNSLFLSYTVVPEPSTAVLCLAVLAWAMPFRRRQGR